MRDKFAIIKKIARDKRILNNKGTMMTYGFSIHDGYSKDFPEIADFQFSSKEERDKFAQKTMIQVIQTNIKDPTFQWKDLGNAFAWKSSKIKACALCYNR